MGYEKAFTEFYMCYTDITPVSYKGLYIFRYRYRYRYRYSGTAVHCTYYHDIYYLYHIVARYRTAVPVIELISIKRNVGKKEREFF